MAKSNAAQPAQPQVVESQPQPVESQPQPVEPQPAKTNATPTYKAIETIFLVTVDGPKFVSANEVFSAQPSAMLGLVEGVHYSAQ